MENIGRSGLVKPESFRRRASPHNEPLPKKTSQLRKLIGVQTKILICRSIFSNIFEGVNKALICPSICLSIHIPIPPHTMTCTLQKNLLHQSSAAEKRYQERCQKPLIIATFLDYHHYSLLYLPQFLLSQLLRTYLCLCLSPLTTLASVSRPHQDNPTLL